MERGETFIIVCWLLAFKWATEQL